MLEPLLKPWCHKYMRVFGSKATMNKKTRQNCLIHVHSPIKQMTKYTSTEWKMCYALTFSIFSRCIMYRTSNSRYQRVVWFISEWMMDSLAACSELLKLGVQVCGSLHHSHYTFGGGCRISAYCVGSYTWMGLRLLGVLSKAKSA